MLGHMKLLKSDDEIDRFSTIMHFFCDEILEHIRIFLSESILRRGSIQFFDQEMRAMMHVCECRMKRPIFSRKYD